MNKLMLIPENKRWITPLEILILVVCAILPGYAVADTSPPAAPASLQGVRYSASAGEIFWSPATDYSTIIGYRVSRDGRSMGVHDARSIFEANLQEDQSHQYTVNAVDRFGNEGPALTVEVSSLVGQQMQGRLNAQVETDTGTEQNQSQDQNQNQFQSSDALSLAAATSRLSLREGDSSGASIELSLSRNSEAKRVVHLSLEAVEGRDGLNIRHVFSSISLQPNQSGSVVTMNLDVGVAPLLHHERRFNVVVWMSVMKESSSSMYSPIVDRFSTMTACLPTSSAISPLIFLSLLRIHYTNRVLLVLTAKRPHLSAWVWRLRSRR
jgi:hypothetical protein